MRYISEDHKEIASGKKKDDEGYMARIELDNIEKSVKKLKSTIKGSDQQLPAWVQSKITRAADYIDSATEYLTSDEELDEGISFTINKKAKRKSVGRDKLLKMTPEQRKQLPQDMVKKVLGSEPQLPNLKKEELSLTERILKEMGCDCDMKPHKNVEQIAKKHGTTPERIKKQLKMGMKVEMEHTTDKNEARSIALQHLAERPDYYTKLKKVEEAKKYMTKDEDPCWKGYKMVGKKKKGGKEVPNCVPIDEGVRTTSQSGQLLNIILNWRGRNIVTQMFFPQILMPKKQEVYSAVQKVYPEAKVISFKASIIDPTMPLIQMTKEDTDLTSQILSEFKSPSWTRKEGKSETGGLNKKGIASYRKENPGSKLSLAVTTPPSELKKGSKRWKRRKSFCARMSGMPGAMYKDGKPTRKKLSLDKWNC